MVATAHALRIVGCPGLELWQRLLPHAPKLRFLEDNQAMLQCVKTGRNPTMRHLARTHRVSVGWIHERHMSGQFIFAHESGERMPPDIFTKMFADKAKWITARLLINVVLPAEIEKVIADNKEIYQGIQDKPALVSTTSNKNPAAGRLVHSDRPVPNGGTHQQGLSSALLAPGGDQKPQQNLSPALPAPGGGPKITTMALRASAGCH